MAFGLVNTMLMAVLERTREFGLLKAPGAKSPCALSKTSCWKSLILLFTGLVAGKLFRHVDH